MGTRLYIGNLSSGARERDIERFFKGYGKIREVVLKNGYGFVASISIYSVCKVCDMFFMVKCVTYVMCSYRFHVT